MHRQRLARSNRSAASAAAVAIAAAAVVVLPTRGVDAFHSSQPPTTLARMHRLTSSSARSLYQAEWLDLLSPPILPDGSATPPPGKITPPRSGATSFVAKTPFVFSGYAEDPYSDGGHLYRYVINDLWKFAAFHNVDEKWGWTKVGPTGDLPSPRLASAAATVGGASSTAVLLGGWDPQEEGTGGVILDDVRALDVDSLRWMAPIEKGSEDSEDKDTHSVVPGGPTSRHVAVAVGDSVVLHNHRCDDHVLLLELQKDGGGDNETMRAEWKTQPTKGNAPSSRGLHCATVLSGDSNSNNNSNGSGSVVVFGGAAQSGEMSNEAFLLDTNTWTWTEIECDNTNPTPTPRAGACLCPLDDNAVLLFGGAEVGDGGLVGRGDVWVLRIDRERGTGTWELLLDDNISDDGGGGIRPPGRNAATLDRIDARDLLPLEYLKGGGGDDDQDEEGEAYFLLQGGWYPFRKTYNDVFVLRVTTSSSLEDPEYLSLIL